MTEASGTLILGIGSILRQDDGVGVRVAQRLEHLALPDGVTVMDGGSIDIGLLDLLEPYERAIIVDAADMGLEAGSVMRLELESGAIRSPAAHLSMHTADIAGVLELARLLNKPLPKLTVIGVQPKELGWGAELSEEVLSVFDHVVDLTLRELGCRITAEDQILPLSESPDATCREPGAPQAN